MRRGLVREAACAGSGPDGQRFPDHEANRPLCWAASV